MSSIEQSSSSSSRSSTTWTHTGSEDTSSTSSAAHSKCDEEWSIRAASTPSLDPLPSQVPSQEWERGVGFWRSFFAICLPLLLSALEGSVTNTALPTISDALDLGTNFSWVATGFLLAGTVFQPLCSQLADIWGRKVPMMFAIATFAAGSAICGGAQSGAVLILGRVVQGLGTGGIDLFAEIILCDIIPLRNRGRYLAIKHAVFATGTTLGPLLGGVFAEHNWRWCFLINLPVCLISLVAMWFWLSVGGGVEIKDSTFKSELNKVDWIGSGILTGSIIMICVALSTGGAPHPWSSPKVVVPFVFGFLGLIAFPFWQCSTYCKFPVMPPHIFSNRTTNIAFVLTAIHGFTTYGFQFFLPAFFQAVKGSSPLTSGKEVLPTTLVIVVLAAVGGPILSVWGKYKYMHVIGFACTTIGLGLCVTLNSETPVGFWVGVQLLTAAGLGIVISTMLPAVQVKLPESTTGASAGSWAFLRGTGSLFGVAIPSAIFNARFSQLRPTIPVEAARARLANGQAYQHASAEFTKQFGEDARKAIVQAFTESLKSIWIVFAVVAGAGFLLTWFEKEHKMRKSLDTAYGLKSSQGPASSLPTVEVSGTPTLAAARGDMVDSERRNGDVV